MQFSSGYGVRDLFYFILFLSKFKIMNSRPLAMSILT